jgi:hypothetical protein
LATITTKKRGKKGSFQYTFCCGMIQKTKTKKMTAEHELTNKNKQEIALASPGI